MKILPCFLTSSPPPRNFDEDDAELGLEATDEEPIYEPQPDHAAKLQGADPSMMGQKALSFVLLVLGAVIALPTISIYLLKAPPPLQDVYTFGVSYYKLLFILNLCAVMLVVSTIAFSTTNFPIIAGTFIVCLFCSIPLIVGLRQGMTMQQAILDISFFSGWPFFIKPMYILTFLLLPSGVLFFIFLQIRTVFSRQPHTYAFGGAALFLALATFFGTYELSRAGQPSVQSALHLQRDQDPVTPDGFASQPGVPGALPPLPSAVVKNRQPPDLNGPSLKNTPTETASPAPDQSGNLPNATPDPAFKATPSTIIPEGAALEGIERKLGTLIDSLDTKVGRMALLQAKAEEKRQAELAALDSRVGALAGKLDAILLQMGNKPPNQTHPPDKQLQAAGEGQETAGPEGSPVSPKADKTMANVNKQIDTLIEKVKSLETKTLEAVP